MRKKTPKAVVTFASTSDAMAVEAAARRSAIPENGTQTCPGCGLAWCVPAEERGALLDALESGGLAYEAVHEVELY